jgi:hypothetical protein
LRRTALDRTEVPQLTLATLFGNGDIDGIFLDIHTDEYAMLFHGVASLVLALCWGCVNSQHNPRLQGWQVFFFRTTGLASAKDFRARMGPGWLVGHPGGFYAGS